MVAMPLSTIQRSRRSRRSVSNVSSLPISNRPVPHHALVVEVEMGELTIACLQVELDFSLCLGGTASNLGDLVFEAVRQIDACPGLRPGYRILDRLAHALNKTSNGISPRPSFHVHLKIYLGEDRLIDLLKGRGEDS